MNLLLSKNRSIFIKLYVNVLVFYRFPKSFIPNIVVGSAELIHTDFHIWIISVGVSEFPTGKLVALIKDSLGLRRRKLHKRSDGNRKRHSVGWDYLCKKNDKEKFQGHRNGVRRMRGQSKHGVEQLERSETRLRQFRVGKNFHRIR